MKKIVLGVIALVLCAATVFAFKKKAPQKTADKTAYEILQKWELPSELKEISGIAWMGENRVACVQDEDGMIFIYNLNTSEIESTQKFAAGGDYEGISVIGDKAFVLRSDGVLFEVSSLSGKNPQVKKHVTSTNKLKGINLEGLCADQKENRLLLAVKERKGLPKYKEVFSYYTNGKASGEDLLFKIDLADPIFEKVDDNLKNKFSPGEIGVHPQTGEYYILDGTKPKLLITTRDGAPKELYMLRIQDFGNPEGLTFNESGELFISNEAEDGPANILKVGLNRK